MERSGSRPMVTEGAAQTVQASQAGCCVATSTTAADVNLTAWASRYVKIVADGADTYFLFANAAGATINEATTQASAASADATIPDLIPAGGFVMQVVDLRFPYLRVKTKAGTGFVRVFRT